MAIPALKRHALKGASTNRLACLLRHWAWADQAKTRFEQQLGTGWEYDADPQADHLFGAYHHWCALLCGFGEAALERGMLSEEQMRDLDPDLAECLPALRASRQLLVSIPASREDVPRIVDLLRGGDLLRRLRRVHVALGDALREEQTAREGDLLDAQER